MIYVEIIFLGMKKFLLYSYITIQILVSLYFFFFFIFIILFIWGTGYDYLPTITRAVSINLFVNIFTFYSIYQNIRNIRKEKASIWSYIAAFISFLLGTWLFIFYFNYDL